MNFYYDGYFNMGSEFTTAVAIENLDILPIKQISDSEQKPFIKLADKMLLLNERLNKLKDKETSEKKKIEDEIKKTDNKIDELVYDLYEITEKERMIIREE